MGEDLSTGAKIGITLVILCSLLTIVFSLLSIMKKTANKGSNNLQNGLDQLDLMRFNDYDQEVVNGTTVLSVTKLFEGEPIAIVIRTSSTATGNCYMNLGALLVGATAKAAPNTDDGSVYALTTMNKIGTNAYYTMNLDQTSGAVKWNMNSKPLSRSGTYTFVRQSAKFLGELIRDETETIVGICFTQQ